MLESSCHIYMISKHGVLIKRIDRMPCQAFLWLSCIKKHPFQFLKCSEFIFQNYLLTIIAHVFLLPTHLFIITIYVHPLACPFWCHPLSFHGVKWATSNIYPLPLSLFMSSPLFTLCQGLFLCSSSNSSPFFLLKLSVL